MDTNLLTFAGVILGLAIIAVVIYKKGQQPQAVSKLKARCIPCLCMRWVSPPKGYSPRAQLAGGFWRATVDNCEKGGVRCRRLAVHFLRYGMKFMGSSAPAKRSFLLQLLSEICHCLPKSDKSFNITQKN
ncbi:hypothetical protein [Nitrospira sp. BLG_1]|uniref:hypothetical protein n=1 Tax=Nitrospira sp. BLG_1 TaxID=3395883 RepID=UPI0039BD1B6B